jgi:hypothetical protein
VLLMLLLDSAPTKKISSFLAACSKQTRITLKPSLHKQQQLPAGHTDSDSVILQLDHSATPAAEPAHNANNADNAAETSHRSSGSTPPATVIIAPASPAAAAAAAAAASSAAALKGLVDSDAVPAKAAAQQQVAPKEASAVDTTKVTEPFPMRRVIVSGACLMLALWAAQVRQLHDSLAAAYAIRTVCTTCALNPC